MNLNADPVGFNARIVFKNPHVEIKPFIMVNRPKLFKSGNPNRCCEPGWLLKLIFGIKKNTKFPSNKAAV